VAERRLARLRVRAEAASRLLQIASARGLVLRDATLERGELWCLVPLLSVPDASTARRELELLELPGFAWEEGLGSVSLVGVGAGAEPAHLARVLEACAAPPIALTATPLRVTALLSDDTVEDSERGVHAAFVSGSGSAPEKSPKLPRQTA
jgi:aspartokinase